MKFLICSVLFIVGLGFIKPVSAGIEKFQNLAHMYLEFEREEAIKNKALADQLNLRQLTLFPEKLDTLGSNLESIKTLVNHVDRYARGESNINWMINKLFKMRFDYIEERYNAYQKYKSALQARSKSVIENSEYKTTRFDWVPTDPKKVNRLKKLNRNMQPDSPIGQWNLMLTRQMVDRYQWISNLLRELLRDTTWEKLTKKNQMWIQCSVSLHDFFSEKTNDAGYAEQACLESDTDDYSLSTFYLCPTHILSLPPGDRSLGADHYKLPATYCTSRYDLFMNARTFPLDYSPEVITTAQKPFPPLPDFKLPRPTHLVEVESDLEKESKAFLLETPAEKEAEKEDPFSIIISPPIKEAKKAAEVISSDHLETSSLKKSSVIEDSKVSTQKKRLIQPPSLAKTKKSQVKVELSESQDRLNYKDQEWLDSLFNRTVKTYRFIDFSKVWKRLNGPDSIPSNESGGSHRRLLDKRGNCVGGIFAHGDSQEYGKGYRKYLIEAFTQIGITNSNLSDTP